ncbi:MAG TPA: hypothetical protein VIY48_04465 [Candidatus Paceibacterota bacterium]
MPIARFQMPDGRIARFEVPEGTTPEQAQSMIAESMAQQPEPTAQAMPQAQAAPPAQPQPRSWGQTAFESVTNIPSSAAEFGKGIYQSVRHPVDTAKDLISAAQGGVVNITPQPALDLVNRIDPGNAARREEVSKIGDAVGQFYKNRYGSMEGFKEAVAKDPVGILSDASMVLSGGATLAPKASTLAKILKAGASATNPLEIAGKAVTGAGRGAANLIGGLGTHTGGESVMEAARAGLAGGEQAKTFAENMRGKVPMTDVLDDAKANLEAMGRAKSAEYRAGMANVSNDKSVLSFDGIDKAIADARGAAQYKGQVKNPRAAEVLQNISDEVAKWKNLDPAEYHTPEGLDALKQKIGAMAETIPFEERSAKLVATKIYNSIKSEITKQAPTYADVMKNYSDATEQIREIERALSLGGKASVDTAMRKLQSLTRNNANTNYGNRLDLARQLEEQGGRQIMPALAGQAMSSWTPRGLGNVVGAATLGGAAYNPSLAAFLPLQSPRLVGEAALRTGQLAGMLRRPAQAIGNTGVDPTTLANILSQTGRLSQLNQQ